MSGVFFYGFAILLFVAVVLFIEGVYVWWNDAKGPEARRIESRLRVMSAGGHGGGEGHASRESILKERLLATSPALHRALLGVPRIHAFDRLLEQSGLPWSVAQLLGLTLALGAIGAILGSLPGWPPQLVLVAALLAAALPLLYVIGCKRRRLTHIDNQLPDALDLMGRALRAGHALPGALQMVADELAEPIAGEFRIVFDEVNYGIAMKDALTNLATRVPIKDLRYFVVAVLIQRDTGGNLAELLDSIAALIRARHKLMGTVRVLSAEGRLSATILCILPFVAAFLFYLINPGLMSGLWKDPLGIRFIVIAAVLMVIGIFWSRQIIRIRV
jgi:tight adherence protein B